MNELIDTIVKLAENAGIEGFNWSHAGHIVNNWSQGRASGENTYAKIIDACDRAEKLPGFPALYLTACRWDGAHDIAMLVSAWAEAHPRVDDEY
jgi:hypothetical protein